MKKKTHILLTGRVGCRLMASKDKALLWGSILPDLLVFTYIRSHTWERSRNKTFRKMKRLSKHGWTDSFSALRLGCILHYIEDYFTYAHNSNFEGTLEEHIKYENEQAVWLTDRIISEIKAKTEDSHKDFFKPEKIRTDVRELIEDLEKMHEKYMLEEPGIENDLKYASKAVSMVCRYYAYIFAVNESRLFDFRLFPDMDYIVDIPRLVARISSMTLIERQAA